MDGKLEIHVISSWFPDIKYMVSVVARILCTYQLPVIFQFSFEESFIFRSPVTHNIQLCASIKI